MFFSWKRPATLTNVLRDYACVPVCNMIDMIVLVVSNGLGMTIEDQRRVDLLWKKKTKDQTFRNSDIRRLASQFVQNEENTWGFPKNGVSQKWMVKIMENPIFSNGWFGGRKPHHFRKPPHDQTIWCDPTIVGVESFAGKTSSATNLCHLLFASYSWCVSFVICHLVKATRTVLMLCRPFVGSFRSWF